MSRFPKPVVLIVDDEPLLRADIADYLSQRGFGVVEANDGPQAIALLLAHPEISAVFTDIQMPGAIDGFAWRNWIRQSRPNMAVLLTSGVSNVVSAASHMGQPRSIVFKPYQPSEVEGRLRALLPPITDAIE